MDPLSIVAGVGAVATLAAQSATFFAQILKSINGAPAEVKTISRDVHAFYAVVFSLNTLLKDDEVMSAISTDASMVALVGSLATPLENSQALLTEIMMKMNKHHKARGGLQTRKLTKINLNWALYNKKEIRDLQLQLEATKSTLNTALSVISMYAGLNPRRVDRH